MLGIDHVAGRVQLYDKLCYKRRFRLVVKLVFVIFVFDMSVVLMNLILGMAVSDIDALQKMSAVKRMTNECFIVKTMEDVFLFIGKIAPFMRRYKLLICILIDRKENTNS